MNEPGISREGMAAKKRKMEFPLAFARGNRIIWHFSQKSKFPLKKVCKLLDWGVDFHSGFVYNQRHIKRKIIPVLCAYHVLRQGFGQTQTAIRNAARA
jgi:hypothetical protein